ncbi:MAG: GLUG motif-containing protein, partial [Phycisphaerales bacterium]
MWTARIVVATAILCSSLPALAYDFAGGIGEPNDPFQIATAEQLCSIGSDPNLLDKHFVLLNDIDLDPNLPGGQVFTQAVIAPDTGIPVGDSRESVVVDAFIGRFDGRGHVIKHLTIRAAKGDFLGLFGRIGPDAWIHDMQLGDASIVAGDGSRWIGPLAGYIEWCRITNCAADGRILVGAEALSIGGLIGFVWGGDVSQCLASCDIRAGDHSESLGGLVGDNGGILVNCCAAGDLSAGEQSRCLGGLIGVNGPSIRYSGGTVRVPGLAVYCYAGGRVLADAASTLVGGLAGQNDESEVIGCFWNVDTSGQSESAGGVGLIGGRVQDSNAYAEVGWDLVDERGNGTADLWLVPGPAGHPVLTVLLDGPPQRRLDGAGTSNDPYRISTAQDLGAVCHLDWSACYRFVRDIDLSGITWRTAPIMGFNGRLDGAGFTLSNLTIRGRASLGLFGALGEHGEIEDLQIAKADVVGQTASEFVGGLAALNEGRILNCSVAGTVSGGYAVGGLVGKNSRVGEVRGCRADASVSRTEHLYGGSIGGLAGLNAGEIVDSCARGDLTGSGGLGGLVGSNSGTIRVCFAMGQVTGYDYLGGLVAAAYGGRIVDCYATGNVLGTGDLPSLHAAGLIGSNDGGTIVRCYAAGRLVFAGPEMRWDRGAVIGGMWDSGKEVVVDCFWNGDADGVHISEGGRGLTTVQMMDPEIYSLNGWGGDPNWVLDPGRDYPRLAWEGTPGEPIPPPIIEWFEGQGTPVEPYLITTSEQLARIGTASVLWDKTFALAADVTLAEIDLPRIGVCRGTDFHGTFDGGDHMISGLALDTGSALEVSHIGLFGFVGAKGRITRLAVHDAVIVCGWGANEVGILAGTNEGTIAGCSTSGRVSVGDYGKAVGGLVGDNTGQLVNCASLADVSGGDHCQDLGGLVAAAYGGRIVDCYATGNV